HKLATMRDSDSLRFLAPKGRITLALGNTLGETGHQALQGKPRRGEITTERRRLFRPFRALFRRCPNTQGVALGYHISPLRGFAYVLLAFLLLLGKTSPAAAQSGANVPDPDPEIERKALQVADGFEINLFAADPLLAKPIQINFDPAGRLWVACSEVYPQ